MGESLEQQGSSNNNLLDVAVSLVSRYYGLLNADPAGAALGELYAEGADSMVIGKRTAVDIISVQVSGNSSQPAVATLASLFKGCRTAIEAIHPQPLPDTNLAAVYVNGNIWLKSSPAATAELSTTPTRFTHFITLRLSTNNYKITSEVFRISNATIGDNSTETSTVVAQPQTTLQAVEAPSRPPQAQQQQPQRPQQQAQQQRKSTEVAPPGMTAPVNVGGFGEAQQVQLHTQSHQVQQPQPRQPQQQQQQPQPQQQQQQHTVRSTSSSHNQHHPNAPAQQQPQQQVASSHVSQQQQHQNRSQNQMTGQTGDLQHSQQQQQRPSVVSIRDNRLFLKKSGPDDCMDAQTYCQVINDAMKTFNVLEGTCIDVVLGPSTYSRVVTFDSQATAAAVFQANVKIPRFQLAEFLPYFTRQTGGPQQQQQAPHSSYRGGAGRQIRNRRPPQQQQGAQQQQQPPRASQQGASSPSSQHQHQQQQQQHHPQQPQQIAANE